jgi:hypothetical protein
MEKMDERVPFPSATGNYAAGSSPVTQDDRNRACQDARSPWRATPPPYVVSLSSVMKSLRPGVNVNMKRVRESGASSFQRASTRTITSTRIEGAPLKRVT